MLALIAVPNSRKQVQRRRVQVGRQLASQGLLKRDQPRAVSATDAVDRVEDLAADLVGVQRRRVLALENRRTARTRLQPQLDLVGRRLAAERDSKQLWRLASGDSARTEVALG